MNVTRYFNNKFAQMQRNDLTWNVQQAEIFRSSLLPLRYTV